MIKIYFFPVKVKSDALPYCRRTSWQHTQKSSGGRARGIATNICLEEGSGIA
ncbi:hypothetical protein M7I_2444 [Glarea lozoyensis 74030]|uniref:Uncharacterized protein n=1 Tax=Glarea lozoyensis (strain ATCC 74030 / MF5533) TaxID=1104152 RepID=H0EIS8_GLAL7|nr:hypothetical protein M7I_2444 [Glarea lozoyensis 74030]